LRKRFRTLNSAIALEAAGGKPRSTGLLESRPARVREDVELDGEPEFLDVLVDVMRSRTVNDNFGTRPAMPALIPVGLNHLQATFTHAE